jgi:hypothetical protein
LAGCEKSGGRIFLGEWISHFPESNRLYRSHWNQTVERLTYQNPGKRKSDDIHAVSESLHARLVIITSSRIPAVPVGGILPHIGHEPNN